MSKRNPLFCIINMPKKKKKTKRGQKEGYTRKSDEQECQGRDRTIRNQTPDMEMGEGNERGGKARDRKKTEMGRDRERRQTRSHRTQKQRNGMGEEGE